MKFVYMKGYIYSCRTAEYSGKLCFSFWMNSGSFGSPFVLLSQLLGSNSSALSSVDLRISVPNSNVLLPSSKRFALSVFHMLFANIFVSTVFCMTRRRTIDDSIELSLKIIIKIKDFKTYDTDLRLEVLPQESSKFRRLWSSDILGGSTLPHRRIYWLKEDLFWIFFKLILAKLHWKYNPFLSRHLWTVWWCQLVPSSAFFRRIDELVCVRWVRVVAYHQNDYSSENDKLINWIFIKSHLIKNKSWSIAIDC